MSHYTIGVIPVDDWDALKEILEEKGYKIEQSYYKLRGGKAPNSFHIYCDGKPVHFTVKEDGQVDLGADTDYWIGGAEGARKALEDKGVFRDYTMRKVTAASAKKKLRWKHEQEADGTIVLTLNMGSGGGSTGKGSGFNKSGW